MRMRRRVRETDGFGHKMLIGPIKEGDDSARRIEAVKPQSGKRVERSVWC